MKKSYSSTILKSTLLLLIFTMAAGMLQSCSSVYDTQRSESKVGSMGSLLGAGQGAQRQDTNVIKY